jgi:hypothetical protein
MTLLTIFATCKPFNDEALINQRNSIASWTRLPDTEVILLGNDEGTAEAARKFNVAHVPDVPCSEHGTPLVSGLFALAKELSPSPLLGYVNSDMVLLPDFIEAIRRIKARRFLMVGRSIGITVREELDFEDETAVNDLKARARRDGEMRDGLDYFVFTRDLYDHIPELIVGRGYWDHWLIYYPRTRGARVYDATDVTTVIHQDHGWSHVEGGEKWIWKGPEIEANRQIVGDFVSTFGNADVTWRLSESGSSPVINKRRVRRALELAGRRRRLLRPVTSLLLKAAKAT